VNDDHSIQVENPEVKLGACTKCQGTGHYVVNGIDFGICFDCGGKGVFTLRDELRDRSYHAWRAQQMTEDEEVSSNSNEEGR